MDRAKTPAELMEDSEGVQAALRRGVREALRRHKALGHPVVFFDDDGTPVVVRPEELEIPEEDEP